MKISEVIDVLEELKKIEDDRVVLGISVNNEHITVCYEDSDFRTRSHKCNYVNCDSE